MPAPTTVLYEAKRRVRVLADMGKLISPRDAWLLSGGTREQETLWSVSFSLAMETDTSAEEINEYLEEQFPHYTTKVAQTYHWDDFHAE